MLTLAVTRRAVQKSSGGWFSYHYGGYIWFPHDIPLSEEILDIKRESFAEGWFNHLSNAVNLAMATPPSEPNHSTYSLESDTTVSPATPFGASPPSQKDYHAAFATLQSRYGTIGNIPSPKKDPSHKLSTSMPSIQESACNSCQTTLTSSAPSDMGAGSAQGRRPRKKSKGSILTFLFKGEPGPLRR